MKYDIKSIYIDRLEMIDKQLIVYMKKKQWSEVKRLREEKKSLQVKINELEAKS